ncbi:Pr6Pr family membrane protein [Cellulomonas fimi]|uniref:Pr6Pr family membrane protein n=1 Tax=Cellulomonas sp. RIT-PI-Y TaxID=3035297 RepID=UPI0021D8E251
MSPGARSVATRVSYGVLALGVLVGLGLEIHSALTTDPGAAITRTERLVRLFSYFTIQSNLLVLIAAVLLVSAPHRGGRLRAVIRLDALLCIAVTGVIYHALLSGYAATLAPAGRISDFLLHTFAPIATWLIWLVVGPHGDLRWSTVGWAVGYPLVWIASTFVRGAITGWYPYDFLDAGALGLGRALLNTAAVALGFLLLATLARGLDRVLPGSTGPAPTR